MSQTTPSQAASERAAGAPTAQVISLSELPPPSNADASAASGAGLAAAGEESHPLHHVKARLTVCVGSVVMSVGELLNARKDQVLRLDSAVQDPVDLLIEGKVVARGQLVAMDDHFAVRITQLPQTLKV